MERVDSGLAEQAEESLGAASAIAHELGMPELAASAADAFTESLQLTGVVGGIIMIAVAALVFFLTPKGTNVAKTAH